MVSEAVIRTYQIHMWHVSHIHRVIVEEGKSEAEPRLPRGLKIDLVSASVPQKLTLIPYYLIPRKSGQVMSTIIAL